LKYFKDEDKEPPHNRLDIRFDNGYHLAFDCQRKLGLVTVVTDMDTFIHDHELGPDALGPDFTEAYFKKKAGSSRGSIKSLLMNQHVVSGIGNIYSDEILFQAGIHPKQQANALREKDVATVFKQINRVLETAISAGAQPEDFPKNYLIPHRGTGEHCPQCGGDVASGKVSGRTSYWCPQCQKGQ